MFKSYLFAFYFLWTVHIFLPILSGSFQSLEILYVLGLYQPFVTWMLQVFFATLLFTFNFAFFGHPKLFH